MLILTVLGTENGNTQNNKGGKNLVGKSVGNIVSHFKMYSCETSDLQPRTKQTTCLCSCMLIINKI